jgi:hypothetical protein
MDKPHIEFGDGATKKLTDKQIALVRRGAELTRMLKDHKKELDEINDQLKKDIGPGVSLVLPNEVRVPITAQPRVSITDADGLKNHVGTRLFNKVVAVSISYKPTDGLFELEAQDAFISEFLNRASSVAVKYLPIKTAK